VLLIALPIEPTAHAMGNKPAKNSTRSVSGYPRHAVEVSIIAGNLGQALDLQEGDGKRVGDEEAEVLAKAGSRHQERGRNRQDGYARLHDALDGRPKLRERLHGSGAK
jgi:hypothetical protein